jgi:hypothetical protein
MVQVEEYKNELEYEITVKDINADDKKVLIAAIEHIKASIETTKKQIVYSENSITPVTFTTWREVNYNLLKKHFKDGLIP